MKRVNDRDTKESFGIKVDSYPPRDDQSNGEPVGKSTLTSFLKHYEILGGRGEENRELLQAVINLMKESGWTYSEVNPRQKKFLKLLHLESNRGVAISELYRVFLVGEKEEEKARRLTESLQAKMIEAARAGNMEDLYSVSITPPDMKKRFADSLTVDDDEEELIL